MFELIAVGGGGVVVGALGMYLANRKALGSRDAAIKNLKDYTVRHVERLAKKAGVETDPPPSTP